MCYSLWRRKPHGSQLRCHYFLYQLDLFGGSASYDTRDLNAKTDTRRNGRIHHKSKRAEPTSANSSDERQTNASKCEQMRKGGAEDKLTDYL